MIVQKSGLWYPERTNFGREPPGAIAREARPPKVSVDAPTAGLGGNPGPPYGWSMEVPSLSRAASPPLTPDAAPPFANQPLTREARCDEDKRDRAGHIAAPSLVVVAADVLSRGTSNPTTNERCASRWWGYWRNRRSKQPGHLHHRCIHKRFTQRCGAEAMRPDNGRAHPDNTHHPTDDTVVPVVVAQEWLPCRSK